MSQKGGTNPQVGDANLLFLAIFTRKLFEIEKKLDQGCVLSTPPLGSTTASWQRVAKREFKNKNLPKYLT